MPDILRMPLVSPEGIELVPFLAVESNTDYWSVLWNGRRLRDDVIDTELNIVTGGLGVGAVLTSDCVANDSNFRSSFPDLATAN